MSNIKHNQKGALHYGLIILLVFLALSIFAGYRIYSINKSNNSESTTSLTNSDKWQSKLYTNTAANYTIENKYSWPLKEINTTSQIREAFNLPGPYNDVQITLPSKNILTISYSPDGRGGDCHDFENDAQAFTKGATCTSTKVLSSEPISSSYSSRRLSNAQAILYLVKFDIQSGKQEKYTQMGITASKIEEDKEIKPEVGRVKYGVGTDYNIIEINGQNIISFSITDNKDNLVSLDNSELAKVTEVLSTFKLLDY